MRNGSARTLATLLVAATLFGFAGAVPAQEAGEPQTSDSQAADSQATDSQATESQFTDTPATDGGTPEAEPAATSDDAAAVTAAEGGPPADDMAAQGSDEGAPATDAATPAAVDDTAAAGPMTAAQDTAAGVYDQGRRLWREALVPMAKRLAAAAPVVLKAIVVLAIFWILAMVLGAATTKLLSLTSVDEQIARDWGLDSMLRGEDDEPRSIDRLGGKVVKWVVLLFGFVAFFDALDLGMVAGPLQGILNNIAAVVPALLQAVVILLGYWIVATILKMGASRGLAAVGFDDRAAKYLPPREVKGEVVPASGIVGRLLFYVVLLFGIPPFLDALGQESLVAPLRDMLSKALTYVPNIIAALILVFVGRLIATVVREVTTNFLVAVGLDRFAERFGFGKAEGVKPLSAIVGTVAFFFILVPVLVAAVDALGISAISVPVRNTLEQVLSVVPLVFGAVIVVGVGYYIANAVRGIVSSFLSGIGFDALPGKVGLQFLKPREGGSSLSDMGGTVVMALILLLTAEQALATLELDRLSDLVGDLIRYLPSLAVGLVIILAALSIGSYVGDLVSTALAGSRHQGVMSGVARYAVIFLGASMGLTQLGVGQEIIEMVVAAVVGGAALAVGLAFGLGGKDRAREALERSEIL